MATDARREAAKDAVAGPERTYIYDTAMRYARVHVEINLSKLGDRDAVQEKKQAIALFLNSIPQLIDSAMDMEVEPLVIERRNRAIRKKKGEMPTACQDCGLDFALHGADVIMPNEHWKQIFPSEHNLQPDSTGLDGHLCGTCIARRAAKIPGVVAIRARLQFASEFPDALEPELPPRSLPDAATVAQWQREAGDGMG